jgi:hypothetical protein
LERKAIEIVSRLLCPFEVSFYKRFGEEGIKKFPPILIIGAPRCGSTLLYKVLTEKYKFCYFSNFTCKFHNIPSLASWFQDQVGIKAPRGNYDFLYGRIDGLGSPSECGQFWYRWFPGGMHVYVPPKRTQSKALDELRQVIGGISYISGSPMIFKNLYNSMRIAPIMEAIPEARFIVCRRDMIDNALSILKGRVLNLVRKDIWWSTPPKEIETLLKMHYSKQVAGQVHYIYKQIEEDKVRFGIDRFFDVQYEIFSNDVHGTLREIEQFLNLNDNLVREKSPVPHKFEVMEVEGIDEKDRMLVEDACQFF